MLRAELVVANAKVRDLQQRMFGRKSERRKGGRERQGQASVSRAARGHQRGAPGHGRTMQSHLPERIEWVEMDTPQCPRCGLALSIFPGSEDSEVLEIEVQAYRRVIRRRRYRALCECGCVPAIRTGTVAPLLAERHHAALDRILPFVGAGPHLPVDVPNVVVSAVLPEAIFHA
jgi:transposase